MKEKPNGAIKIEKGIPMPGPRQDIGLMDAITKMDVGDSFLIGRGHYASVRSLASMQRKTIRTRKVGADHIRVWCVGRAPE